MHQQQHSTQSGCQNVRIEKEPIDYSGVGLRKLSLEGEGRFVLLRLLLCAVVGRLLFLP